MKKFFMFLLLVVILTCFSGCIHGEIYIAPPDSLLSHPVTKEEVPDYYERRWLNGQPHRNHYRSKDREWSSNYKFRGGTR